MTITGKVTKVLDTQSGTNKSGEQWQKGGFVIETESQYPKKIAISTWGDVANYSSKLKSGEKVTAHIDIESRKYNDRWYTNVKAWKIESNTPKGEPVKDCPQPEKDDNSDDLPF